jgi:hypothetical protein
MLFTTLMLRFRKTIEHTACEWLFFGWIVLGLMVLCLPLLTGCNAGVDSANGANPQIPENGGHGHGLNTGSTVSLSPTSSPFSANQGGSDPEAQTATISNSQTGTLGWDVDTIAAWLSLPPVSAADQASLTAPEDIAGLAAASDVTTMPDTGVDATSTPESIPDSTILPGPGVDGTTTPESIPADLLISTSPPELPTDPSTASDTQVWDPAMEAVAFQN